MKKTLLILSLCLIAPLAMADRMQDYSLSPSETSQQPDITHSQPNNFNNDYQQPSQPQQPSYYHSHGYGGSSYGSAYNQAPANSFMAGYCDPNFMPLVNTGNLQACFRANQQKACEAFQQLPPEVQKSLDAAIGCAYNAANDDSRRPEDCSGFDTDRINFVKKYWQDQNTTYAIVFLPDIVLNGTTNCSRGGR